MADVEQSELEPSPNRSSPLFVDNEQGLLDKEILPKEADQKLRDLRGPDSIDLLRRVLLKELTDVIILALDFGYIADEGNKVTQTGICTLSTSKWREFSPTADVRTLNSRCVRTPIKSLVKSNFLFGESEVIYRRNLVDFLQHTLANKKPDGTPQKVILVGCATLNELRILKSLGIDLRDNNLFAIEGILDINTITQTLDLPFKTRPSLKRILQQLKIPFREEYLHDSGNDAHFTLRALLMLAAMAFERTEADETVRQRIESLKAIALDPIDFNLTTPDEMKRLKRDQDAKRAAKCRAQTASVTRGEWSVDEDVEVCLDGSFLWNGDDI